MTPDAESVRLRLAAWWEANARDLPWRFGRATPWGVLVSEVMSQQTQMSRVVPYWTQWMERWPDAAALAAAPKADVITAWGRLGYPRRALRLQECARVVSTECGDELPRTYDALIALPGVGDYTASAVMSFAYGERIAVIDTNIRRVLARVFRGEESRGGAASLLERALAAEVLPKDGAVDDGACGESARRVPRPVSHGDKPVSRDVSRLSEGNGEADGGTGLTNRDTPRLAPVRRREPRSVVWNQSVMELGALVCTAKNPLCDHCPVSGDCAFLAAGRPGLGERRTRPRQRFQGTDRQVRGIVLKALRDLSFEKAGMVGGRDASVASPVSDPTGPDSVGAPGGGGSVPRMTTKGVDERVAPRSLPRARVEELWKDRVQLDACIAGLDEDGLIEILDDGSLRLPRG
ncbi:A/G-specific adenine glycosylase [Bifidobacterium santillanense]|uniref:A/G-specific adenine glycosylase n=1 Tax=Bifidobacterium santillanense TaxID=2809028 RepID=UPI001F0A0B94|nr:A/G-specific adenine glycosylase [Bifidobacterium santillanense]